jgi:hypothetical protein
MHRAGLYPIETPLGDQTIVESEGMGDGVTTQTLAAMFRQMEDAGSVDHQVLTLITPVCELLINY